MRDQLLRAKLENSQLAAQLNSPPLSPESKTRRAPPPPRSPRSSEAGEASRVSSKSQHRSSKSQQRALASHPPPPGPPPPPPHLPSETSANAVDTGEEQSLNSEVERGAHSTEKRRSRSKSANRGAMSPPPMPPPPPPPHAPKHHDYESQDGNSSVDLLSNSNAFEAPSKRSAESSRRGPSPLSRSSRPKDAPASPMSPGPRVRSSLRPSSRTPRGSEAELADVTDSDPAQPEGRGRDQRRPSGAPRPPSPVSARKRPSSKDPSSPRASRMLQSSLGSPGGVASALSPGPRRSRAQPMESSKADEPSKDLLAHQPSSPSNQPPSIRPSSRPSSRSSTHSQSVRGQSAEPTTSSSKDKATPESLPRRGSSASPRSKPPSALTSELLRTSPLFRPASPLSSTGNKDDASLGSAASEHFASEDNRGSSSSAARGAGKSQSTTSPRHGVPPPSKLQQRQVNMRKSTPSFSTAELESSDEPSRTTRTRASINTFSNTELSEHGRSDERIGRGRRSAGAFNLKELEEQPIVPRVSQFLDAGERTGRPAASAHSSSITSAFSSASPAKKDKVAASSSTATSSPRLSSSAARSSSSTRASAHLVSNTPRFKEAPSADSEAEAAAKRAAYKEQCEREILEFQKNLAMEDGVSHNKNVALSFPSHLTC